MPSKQPIESKPENAVKRFFKSRALPWAIIAIVVIYGAGVWSGWVGRSADNARIHAEASKLVSESK